MRRWGILPSSLQARVLLLVLGLVMLVWLVAAALIWRDARHELDELLDGHLAQAAALLVVQQAHGDDDDEVMDAPSLHKYAPRVVFQVFHEGRLLLRSAQAGTAPMSAKLRGFSTVQLDDGAHWRVFAAQGAERDIQVYVGERIDARSSILRVVLRSVLLPLLVALPLLALALWWAVRQGIAPLRTLSRTLAQRQPQALEPLATQSLAAEMRPLVAALNDLFVRIEQMMAFERRFTADAAHELRTPIAAIRAQAQVALGAGEDRAQREHALKATLAGCDRATHLVEQLLELARLEQAPAGAGQARTRLHALVQQVAADLAPQALAQQQTLALDADEACEVGGAEALWRVLVRNLLDNALRYSPPGAQVQVSLQCSGGQVELRVQDSGPGMTPEQLERLGERFFRVLGSEHSGSGLGWSIVRRVAQALGASVQADRSPELGGLRVTVRCSA
jgi:two-component system sensor histidine kinase QseC